MHHINRRDWLFTAKGEPRGYIQPQQLQELWFHTGTICNLSCPFCLEGSKPGDNRLERMALSDVQPFIDEAITLGVEQFSFTGGEPFVVADFINILDYALNFRPCLVLTNATEPLMNRLGQVLKLKEKPHPLNCRVSLDFPDPQKHDEGRGKGNFRKALKTLGQLHAQGFQVSVARQETPGENRERVNRAYAPFLKEVGVPDNIHFVSFPDFLTPGSYSDVPDITENCMTTYKDERSRSEFMCNNSKMVVKKNGQMRVFACTLVDDDEDYDFGSSLTEAMKVRVMLKHHRCYSCFAWGASCSELHLEESVESPEPLPLEILMNNESVTAGGNGKRKKKKTEISQTEIRDKQELDMKTLIDQTDVLDQVKEYYGKILTRTSDLKTSACCSTEAVPAHIKRIYREIDREIMEKFYGCGSPLPPVLSGRVILDLGCGTGRDVYLAARLAGPSGRAIGVDMTGEQLEVAQRHIDSQMKRFGFPRPNVEFYQGYIEDLQSLGIADNSVDVVISNCVLNLSPDKPRVFSEIFRVLKPGGELYFSDVFSGRRVPEDLRSDPVLYGECLAGALYIEDFRRLLRELGILDYRVTAKTRISLDNPEIEAKVGMVDFYSMTIRAFKLDTLEDICEDYGQVAIYRGTIPEFPHQFDLDDHHQFITGKPMLVCGNTASMLQETRYADHFEVIGDRSKHFGVFDCSGNLSMKPGEEEGGGACGC